MSAPTAHELDFLRSLDTPTVCNLIEIAAPERRGSGYTVKHLHCPFPDLAAMVGFAKTVTIKARDAIAAGDASYMQRRLEYLDYVAAEPRPRAPAGRPSKPSRRRCAAENSTRRSAARAA